MGSLLLLFQEHHAMVTEYGWKTDVQTKKKGGNDECKTVHIQASHPMFHALQQRQRQ
jgi:hypothetical protein